MPDNPNISRSGGPPPPYGADPPPAAQASASVTVEHQQQQAPIYGPPVEIGIGGPAFGYGIPPIAPFGVGFMNPHMYGAMGGGPLAPIRAGNFMPGGDGGISFGLHTAGVPIPPPPPGAVAGMLSPFAPIAPLWSSGLAFGNVPAAGAGLMGGVVPPMMGMGMSMYMNDGTMHRRPAPVAIDGNLGFPAQPQQQEVTAIPGGIPPGVALVESAEHTIAFFIRGNTCPWLSPGAQFVIEPLAFSSATGINRLIQVANNGADAEACAGWAITECIELGNGFFEKGQTFRYGDAVSMVMTMGDVGWDKKRNREGGQSLHLWLHRV